MTMVVWVLWLVCSGIVAFMAWRRGRSPIAWLVASIFLSPIVGYLVVRGLGENTTLIDRRRLESDSFKQCPHCGRSTPEESAICQACGRVIGDYSRRVVT